MTITAVSSGAIAVQCVIDLLAKSDTFQQRIADYHEIAKSEANARLYLFGYELYKPATRDESGDEITIETRPFGVVGLSDQNWSAIVQCSVMQYLPAGTIVVALTDEARFTDCYGESPEDDYNDSYIDALNFFAGVVDDCSDPATSADATFPPMRIEFAEAPYRTEYKHRTDGQDYWTAILTFTFGEQGGAG